MTKSVFGSRAAERKGPRYTTATRQLQIGEDILPIAELKARLSEIVRGLDVRGRPYVVTLNGKPAAVLMSPREYDRMTYNARFLAEISAGMADAIAGRTISDEELGRRMDRRIKSRK
jgi:prevent-host-death family protein